MVKMQPVITLALIVLCFGTVWGQYNDVDRWHPPMDVVASLPKMCWGFFQMPNVPDTPEYNLMLTCGVWANHYCPGLVGMKVAEKVKTKEIALEYLSAAKIEMEYTLRFVKDTPECLLNPRAKMNLESINFQLQMLKGQKYGR